jgi:predicted permease
MSLWDWLLRRHQREEELDEEVRSHLRMAAKERIEQGESVEQARTSALREFGNVALVKEVTRDTWGLRWLEALLQDLRYGLRMPAKSPGFTAVAVLTLALGIGANTAIFSVVDAVLLRPRPYRDPERLAVIWTDNIKQNLHQERTSYPNFEDWRKQSRAFEDMAFSSAFTVNLTAGDEPERVVAARNTPNLFKIMGVKPILGRTFSAEEADRGERLIVLSYGMWQRRFGGSGDVVGKSLEVDGARHVVIGVMPSSFDFPARDTVLWEPLTLFPGWERLRLKRNIPSGFVVGRLKPGFTLAQAQSDMNLIGTRLATQYPELATSLDFFGFGVNVVPLALQLTGKDVRFALWLLFGAVVLVLFIACTNVANLMLSRGVARTRELAVRAALGAGRSRLVGQLFTESLLLYLASGAGGVGIAVVADRTLTRLAPADIPRLGEAGLNIGMLGFALGVSLAAALAFGLAPALRISKTDPHRALKEAGPSLSQAQGVLRLRSMLVIGELALALVLLASAGLLIRSFIRVEGVDPGFRPDHVLTARVVQSKSKSNAQWADFYAQALERIKAIPGVEAAGAVDNFFFSSFPDEAIVVEGRAPLPPGSSMAQVMDDGISPDFLLAVGVPLLRGRFFTVDDRPRSPRTAIINATMAHRFWIHADPIGQRFKFSYQQPSDPWITVVGIVGDMRRDGLAKEPVSQVFLPLAQDPARGMDLLVRTATDPRNFVTEVRSAIHSADKTAPVFDVNTLEAELRDQNAPRRFQALLLGLFAILALVLAMVGVYGVTAYSARQRTQEIGIRVALGARQSDVFRLVLGRGFQLTVAGLAIGMALSLTATRLLRSELFGVATTDPLTFASVALVLSIVALVACYVPARRATKVDPMVALRYE